MVLNVEHHTFHYKQKVFNCIICNRKLLTVTATSKEKMVKDPIRIKYYKLKKKKTKGFLQSQKARNILLVLEINTNLYHSASHKIILKTF